MKKPIHLPVLALAAAFAVNASATDFTISGASTTQQTLNSGDTLTVASAGSLTLGGSTLAVVIGGSSTLTNLGTIEQTGSAKAIRDNVGGDTVHVINGSATNASALIQAAVDDPFQMNKASSAVTLDNWGTINSRNTNAGGAQAVDWGAVTASNTLNNYATGKLTANEADAVRPGAGGVINNSGTIKSTNNAGSTSGSDGVDAQSNSGIQINNAASATGAGTGLIEGARHGITGGANGAYTMTITNGAGGTIQADAGSGINIDGNGAGEQVTITNHGTITGNGVTADGDGVDVDGVVIIINDGTIKSNNAVGSNSEGITVGGGSITNYAGGLIEGDVAAGNTAGNGRGITVAGIDTSGSPESIYADTSITNSGVIKGQTDSGIAIEGPGNSFKVTIDNHTGGLIQGGGSAGAIQVISSNDTTINNAGSIVASGAGRAIALGSGNDTVNVTGGAASITGDIGGGGGTNVLNLIMGNDNTFAYAGEISNFDVAVQSGVFTPGAGGDTVLITDGDLSESSGAILLFDIAGAAAGVAGGYDQIVLTNGAAILDGTIQLTIETGVDLAVGNTFTLIDAANGISGAYTTTFTDGSNVTFDGVDFQVSYAGGDFSLIVVAVPEPGTVAFLLIGAGAMALRFSRKRPARN